MVAVVTSFKAVDDLPADTVENQDNDIKIPCLRTGLLVAHEAGILVLAVVGN